MNDQASRPSAPPTIASSDARPAILAWLWLLFAMVFGMVVIGGITRLTESGLSMVDWHPLMGALPPLTEADWQHVFERYQESPQFREVNHWMTLESFERIFFWEYVHRLSGRLIAIVSAVPWLALTFAGRISPWLSRRVLVTIALGGCQGLLGWFMVKSGLVDRPEVSHFRLAAHLLLAFFIGQWILWTLLDLDDTKHAPRRGAPRRLRRLIHAGLVLLIFQILYGAFMAGTGAGVLYPTFPDLNGAYAPMQFFPLDSVLQNLLYSPITIHYLHRVLALALLIYAIVLWPQIHRLPSESMPRWSATPFLIAILLQIALGALTVLHRVPISLAVVHQATGFLVTAALTLLLHHCRPTPSSPTTTPL